MARALVVAAVVLGASACLEPALALDAGLGEAAPTRCSPLTCTGCCLGDTCLGGNADDACGYDGRACRSCSAATRCQSPGACISVPADAGTTETLQFQTLERPTDPYSGNPVIDPPKNRCVWVFGFPVCN